MYARNGGAGRKEDVALCTWQARARGNATTGHVPNTITRHRHYTSQSFLVQI